MTTRLAVGGMAMRRGGVRALGRAVALSLCFLGAAVATAAEPGPEAGKVAPPSIAALHARCAKNDQAACSDAARAYQKGDGVTIDANEAAKFYEKACRIALAGACTTGRQLEDEAQLGVVSGVDHFECLDCGMVTVTASEFLTGETATATLVRGLESAGRHAEAAQFDKGDASTATVVDVQKGVALLERACTAGYLDACNSAAHALWSTDGPSLDPVRAAALWRRACDRGLQATCGTLDIASIYVKALQKHVSDERKVAKQLDAICMESKVGAACDARCSAAGGATCEGASNEVREQRGLKPIKRRPTAGQLFQCEKLAKYDACEDVCAFDNAVCIRGCARDANLCRIACENGSESSCLDRCAAWLVATSESAGENPCQGLKRVQVQPRMIAYLERELDAGCRRYRETGDRSSMQGFAFALTNARRNLPMDVILRFNARGNACIR